MKEPKNINKTSVIDFLFTAFLGVIIAGFFGLIILSNISYLTGNTRACEAPGMGKCPEE